MKTVLFKEVDGYKIIKGFDSPNIDPVKTRDGLNSAILKLDAYKSIETLKQSFNSYVIQRNQALKNAKAASNEESKAGYYYRSKSERIKFRRSARPNKRSYANFEKRN